MLWYSSTPESDGYAEDLLRQSRKNFQSFLLITIEYFKENNLDLDSFFEYIGEQSITSWEGKENPTLENIARVFDFNLVSLGMHCIEQKKEDDALILIYTPMVAEADLDRFHISSEDFDKFWMSLKVIADHFDIQCSIDHKEEQFQLTLKKN